MSASTPDPHYFKDGNGLHPRWRFFFKWPKQYLWMVSPRWFKSLRFAVQRRRRGLAAKVYTVWELDYESQDVLSVWTTREAADAELERVKARGYSYGYQYQVFEHTLNEPWSDQ